MTPRVRCAAALVAVLLVPAGRAQTAPPFVWERVGDRPISGIDLAFDSGGSLWATGSQAIRLLSAGTDAWLERDDWTRDGVLALAPDTVFVTNGFSTYRSVDTGVTFTRVHEGRAPLGGRVLAEDDHGTLYTATAASASRSTDRGATWTPAKRPSEGAMWGWAVLPLPDSVAAGRVLLGGLNGATLADVAPADTAWALRPSSLWSGIDNRYAVLAFALVAGPGGAARLLAAGIDTSRPDLQMWASDDAGETWALRSRLPSPEGANNYPAGVLAVGGASVVVGFQDGRIYRSDDTGERWTLIDTLPGLRHPLRLSSLVLGPEGDRFYASIFHAGSFDDAWVIRTAPPSTSATEAPGETSEGSVVSLSVDPNPSSSGASVRLVLGAEAQVRVSVVDTRGRTVSVLHDGRLGVGAHTLALDAAGLAPGVYVVHVATRPDDGSPSQALVRRITVAR